MRRKQLADVTNYETLRTALRARKEALGVAGHTLDAVAGVPEGYFSKLLTDRPQRRIGWDSLLPVLGSLGCRLILVDDPAARRRNAKRKIWEKRVEAQVRRVRCAPVEMVHGT